MAKKTSAAQKARYQVYATQGTAEKNKKIKLARHAKAHPNDAQAQARKPGSRAGFAAPKRTPEMAKLERAVRHDQLFGKVKMVPGRDLSTKAAAKAFLDSMKAKPSIRKAA